MTVHPARRLFVGVCLLFVLVLGAVSSASASGPGGKLSNPYLNDPRSGAALNRDAALHPTAAASPLFDLSSTPLFPPVNNPAADATAQDTQSETTLTAQGNKVVVAFNDSGSFLGGASKFTGFSRSHTSGASFSDRGALPTNSFGDAGDPNLAVNTANHDIFLATLAFNVTNAIPVFKSTNGGQSFGAPVNGIPGGSDLDKDWMAIDNFNGAGKGTIYVCATDFGFSPARIVVTHSTDGGATFGPSGGVILSSTGQSQGCSVAVAPDHSVSVAYFRGNAPNALFIRRSTDGGVTFGAEHLVASLNTTSINGGLGLNGGFRTNSFPNLAISPTSGELIVTYNDDPGAGTDNGDVYATWSTDSGTTWSTPLRVPNDNAHDQFTPTVAITPNGRRAMFGYYSRDDDPNNLQFHRRARIERIRGNGSLAASGRSFRLGPNNPPVIGQDPVINPTYMGDYDQNFAPTNDAILSSWSDNRDGDSFHGNQPDVRFASVDVPQPRSDVSVSLTAQPATITAGHTARIFATVQSNGGVANDVFLNMGPAAGLTAQSVTSAGNHCYLINKFVGCSMGEIADGASETVRINVLATAAGTRTVKANVTSSSIDKVASNDTGTTAITVQPGSTTTTNYSTGNIAVPIPDTSTVDVPLAVSPSGTIADVDASMRLNHTFDADLVVSLISPAGTSVVLTRNRGGSADNYGSGPNDCSGTPTTFNDSAATPIGSGTAPFAGSFRPEDPLGNLDGEDQSGTWKLRVADTAAIDTGTIGCFNLKIKRFN